MKALKRLTMALLALGLTVGAMACGGTDKGDASNSGSQTSETVVVGESLTETQFNAAVDVLYNQSNIKITITDGEQMINGSMAKITGSYSYADGKMYMEMTAVANGVSETQYAYVGEVDGTYYRWTSQDKDFWLYDEAEEEETLPEYFLEDVFVWCNYGYFAFSNQTGMMEFTGLSSPAVSVRAVDGKIVSYRFEDTDGSWYSAVITCGSASVGKLPSLG